MTEAHDLARAFCRTVAREMPDALLTDDMTVWTVTGGTRSGRRLFGTPASLRLPP